MLPQSLLDEARNSGKIGLDVSALPGDCQFKKKTNAAIMMVGNLGMVKTSVCGGKLTIYTTASKSVNIRFIVVLAGSHLSIRQLVIVEEQFSIFFTEYSILTEQCPWPYHL